MYTRYHHDVVGVNSRLDTIQAAVLKAKLPHLDAYCSKRREAARKYMNAFRGHDFIILPKTGISCSGFCEDCDCHVFHQFTIRIMNGKRDELAKHLAEKNIPFGVYYPIPLHKQKAYMDPRYNESDFPVTNELINEVISLPMHTELEDDQISFITDTVIQFLKD
jgi:dTDP-4-amino-4,6-dideoxygalactose transaminase